MLYKCNTKVFLVSLLIICVVVLTIAIITSTGHVTSDKRQDALEVQIILKNHRFVPENIRVPSNTKIRLVITNQDATVEEFESHDLHREKLVLPNSSINIMLAPLAPGEYIFFGDFHQDTAQGSLIVH